MGWIGVDLDGTLAHYEGWDGGKIGEPIQPMIQRVKKWLEEGKEVRIITARVSPLIKIDEHYYDNATDELIENVRGQVKDIEEWCFKYFGQILEITCIKDFHMIELWDDRVVRVITNTGERCCNG